MTELKIERYYMPSASLGRENPLPDLQYNQDAHANIPIDHETISAEEAKYMGWGRVNGILPYTIRNNYNREKKEKAWKACVLENEHIRATFLPQLGARLWSLVDKHTGRELLHCNPVFQPCNLGLRNAWISGGVEWNLGMIGHTPFTVDSLYAEKLKMDDGTPVIRFYQYERVRHLIYRLEAALPENSRHLYVRVRIDNAGNDDTAVYWWSNMAVNEKEDVRVVVPADKAFRWGYGNKMAKVPVPYSENFGDVSHTMNLPQAMDFFFDIPEGQRKWIAALDKDGYGFFQSSTDRLIGRKLFVWGMGAGGRHWQEFLSQKGSQYLEIQAGIAHTQLEHLPMAGGETISWLETYGPMTADGEKVQGEDWHEAAVEVERQLEKGVPMADVNAMHKRMAAQLDARSGKIVHSADGWACIEKMICGDEFRSGCLKFPKSRLGRAEKQWLALLENGALPCPDVMEDPAGYQVNDRWFELLKKSVESGKGDHWYARYHLGVMRAYRNDAAGARAEFEKSVQMQKSPWALRCLAVLARQEGDIILAGDLLLNACNMKMQRNLALETVETLIAAERWTEAENAIKAMPRSIRSIGRMKIMYIGALLGQGRWQEAEKLLMGSIVLTDVKEGEVLPSMMFFKMCAQKKAAQEGIEVTEELIEEMSRTVTPPVHLDFRMN